MLKKISDLLIKVNLVATYLDHADSAYKNTLRNLLNELINTIKKSANETDKNYMEREIDVENSLLGLIDVELAAFDKSNSENTKDLITSHTQTYQAIIELITTEKNFIQDCQIPAATLENIYKSYFSQYTGFNSDTEKSKVLDSFKLFHLLPLIKDNQLEFDLGDMLNGAKNVLGLVSKISHRFQNPNFKTFYQNILRAIEAYKKFKDYIETPGLDKKFMLSLSAEERKAIIHNDSGHYVSFNNRVVAPVQRVGRYEILYQSIIKHLSLICPEKEKEELQGLTETTLEILKKFNEIHKSTENSRAQQYLTAIQGTILFTKWKINGQKIRIHDDLGHSNRVSKTLAKIFNLIKKQTKDNVPATEILDKVIELAISKKEYKPKGIKKLFVSERKSERQTFLENIIGIKFATESKKKEIAETHKTPKKYFYPTHSLFSSRPKSEEDLQKSRYLKIFKRYYMEKNDINSFNIAKALRRAAYAGNAEDVEYILNANPNINVMEQVASKHGTLRSALDWCEVGRQKSKFFPYGNHALCKSILKEHITKSPTDSPRRSEDDLPQMIVSI
jgi:hypothetical protein